MLVIEAASGAGNRRRGQAGEPGSSPRRRTAGPQAIIGEGPADGRAARGSRRSRGVVVDSARRALAEANLAALEGDAARLERALAAGRGALPRGMDPGLNQLTADQLDAV